MTAPLVHTIGHSNHPIARFVEILRAHGVDAVADVRSHPYSRFAPQFRREPLHQALAGAEIAYVFLGAELGARTDDPACWCDGAVDYDRLAATPLFQAGLDRVQKGASDRRIALLCMERDPLTCHRCILVGRHLAPRGLALAHIRFDGTVETGADADARLMRETGTVQGDVLAPNTLESGALARAYDIRAKEIAYRKKPAR